MNEVGKPFPSVKLNNYKLDTHICELAEPQASTVSSRSAPEKTPKSQYSMSSTACLNLLLGLSPFVHSTCN